MRGPRPYLGGEALKVSLLKTCAVPIADGLAPVIVAKTTMTIAQILYILTGIGLGMWVPLHRHLLIICQHRCDRQLGFPSVRHRDVHSSTPWFLHVAV